MVRKVESGSVKSGGSKVRLVVADAYPLMLNGLKELFEREPGFVVVATARSTSEVIDALRRLDPDVLLLDGDLPQYNGDDPLNAIRNLPWNGRVVLHASSLDHRQALEALRLGVPGVILKTMTPDLLLQCVQRVHDGHQWLEKDSLSQVLEVILQRQHEKQQMEARLTPREAEVVRLAANGFANKKIAKKLSISTSTVKSHLHNIYEKLEVEGRWELSQLAREREL